MWWRKYAATIAVITLVIVASPLKCDTTLRCGPPPQRLDGFKPGPPFVRRVPGPAVLYAEQASIPAPNRFTLPGGSDQLVVRAGDVATVRYDREVMRWAVVDVK